MVAETFTAVKGDDGKMHITAPKRYEIFVGRLGAGEARSVTFRPVPKRQGTQSMRYLRGVVVPDIAAACGYTDPDEYQDVFESLAWKFLRMEDHALGHPRRRSTAKDAMTQGEMTTFIDQCITWAETSIPGCRVRRPDEIEDWREIPDYEWND